MKKLSLGCAFLFILLSGAATAVGAEADHSHHPASDGTPMASMMHAPKSMSIVFVLVVVSSLAILGASFFGKPRQRRPDDDHAE